MHRARKAAGLCLLCGEAAQAGHWACGPCETKNRELGRTKRVRERDAVFAVYGSSCACCGESERDFLSIDHVNGGGHQHRKAVSSAQLPGWLRRNNYPDDYQILCMNCNHGRGRRHNGGVCPHKRNEQNAPEYII